MKAARGFGAAVATVSLCWACAKGGHPPTAPASSPPPAALDGDVERCRRFMLALTLDSTESAERDFDARMREELPPSLLRADWHGLQSKYGALSSWRMAQRESASGKQRVHLELQFAKARLDELLVFNPKHEIVGLFFSVPRSRSATSTASAHERAANGASAREIDVSVGPLALGGVLVSPIDAGSTPTPLPGVVFVAGSGPSDRDETVLGVKPFRDLAQGLAARGIASLRFDKRTFAHPESFKGKPVSVESETIEDAIAAVGVLRARPEVDARRIVVLGHSLGALLAPEIATRAGGVSALVLLAAPARPIPELILEQLRAQGAKPGELRALEAKVHSLPTLPPDEALLGAPASYWQDLAQRDEFSAARRLGRPVLLLRGASDQQVAAADQDRWIQELENRVPLDSASMPGLNHLFTQPGSAHVATEVIERVAAFVSGLTDGAR